MAAAMPNKSHVQLRSHKLLTKSSLTRLPFPSAIRAHVWPPADVHGAVRVVQVADRHGDTWHFKSRLRIDARSHLKPEVFGVEWRRFIRDKGLRVGDKVVFYHTPLGIVGPLFQVAVSKKLAPSIRIFGANIQNPNRYSQEN